MGEEKKGKLATYRRKLIDVLAKSYFIEIMLDAKSSPCMFSDDDDYETVLEAPEIFAAERSQDYLRVLQSKTLEELKALYREYSKEC